MLRLLLPVLILAFASGPLVAQSKAWPREFKARPAKLVITTAPDSGHQIATTKHFRFESETKINRPDFERFATVVESVPQLVEKFPLPLWAPPAKRHIDIRICKDPASYAKAGGQGGTIGWYDGRRARVLIRADYFLTPPSRKPTRLMPRPNQDLLVHELAHMCMSGLLWHCPPWLSEGLAEYLSVCHKGNGYYTFHDIGTTVRDRIRNTIGTNGAGKVSLLPVDKILGLTSRGWIETTNSFATGNPYLPYGTALLLTHYHLHGGQPRREKTAKFLLSLRRTDFRNPPPAFPAESAKEIEAKLIKFWGPRGLNLLFEDK